MKLICHQLVLQQVKAETFVDPSSFPIKILGDRDDVFPL